MFNSFMFVWLNWGPFWIHDLMRTLREKLVDKYVVIDSRIVWQYHADSNWVVVDNPAVICWHWPFKFSCLTKYFEYTNKWVLILYHFFTHWTVYSNFDTAEHSNCSPLASPSQWHASVQSLYTVYEIRPTVILRLNRRFWIDCVFGSFVFMYKFKKKNTRTNLELS